MIDEKLGTPPALPKGGLRVIPLGGLGEVGRNMTVFEYHGRLLIVDCGVLFPDDHQPGVDLILPDFGPIRGRLDDVEALVLTHGHEDHIGATPYLLREREDIPLVGSELTLALVNSKIREHRLRQTSFTTVAEGDRISFGPFDLEFVAVNHSIPDALATSANLLKKNGWQAGKTWGYEVAIPAGKLPGGSKTLAQWQALGVVRASGKPFKNLTDKATLKVPDGRGGPAFLMIRNFSVIKAYNNADKYALAVGLLADEIAGGNGLVQDWKRPFTKLTFEERQELQKRLSQHGLYDGKFDGKIGGGSKAAIMAYQAKVGLTQDGYPSLEVLKWLRKQ